MVWTCLFMEVVIVGIPFKRPPNGCGQLELSSLLVLSVLLGMILLILIHDAIQSRRGRLSGLMKWIRTLPTAVAVLIGVAAIGFRLLC